MFLGNKKVIHVANTRHALRRLLLPQCLELRKNGYDISFVSGVGLEQGEVEKEGFIVKEIEMSRNINPLKDVISIYRMYKYFIVEKPLIVHTHTSKAGALGRIAAKLAGVPLLFHTVHGFPFYEGMNSMKFISYQWIEKLLAKMTDIIFSQSKEDIITAKKMRIFPKNNDLVYLGNGIDINKFNKDHFSENVKKEIKGKLGLKNNIPIITTVARINVEKGYWDLLKACQLIKDVAWHLLCVGEDEGLLSKINLKELGLNGKVTFLGPRSDIEEILSVTDIFILASYKEGVPRSVIEAQSMGIPCIVTNIRGSREIVIDGETGYIVPLNSAGEIADRISQLLNNENLRLIMGLKGIKRVEQRYDERMVFDKLIDIYNKYTLSLTKVEKG